jgi:hypothetical protein
MALTPAQKATFKNAIAANTTPAGGTGTYASTPINQIPNTSDGLIAIRYFYNTPTSPTFHVYRTSVPTADIFDQVVWSNLTPSDAPDGTQTWANRSLACQGKQFNLQTLLIGAAGAVNAAKANVRSGLQDALTNVPSGAGGATVAAGWVGVRDNVLARPASVVEKLFATTTAQQDGSTAAKAATMTLEGPITEGDVDAAINS